jgi:hypothetical protein
VLCVWWGLALQLNTDNHRNCADLNITCVCFALYVCVAAAIRLPCQFDPTEVCVTNTNKGAVRFANSAFWGPANQIAKIDGSGTVGFADCTFTTWDGPHLNMSRYAIQAEGTGTVLLTGNDFQYAGSQVSLGDDISRAVVSNNIIKGTIDIKAKKSDSILINNNAASK